MNIISNFLNGTGIAAPITPDENEMARLAKSLSRGKFTGGHVLLYLRALTPGAELDDSIENLLGKLEDISREVPGEEQLAKELNDQRLASGDGANDDKNFTLLVQAIAYVACNVLPEEPFRVVGEAEKQKHRRTLLVGPEIFAAVIEERKNYREDLIEQVEQIEDIIASVYIAKSNSTPVEDVMPASMTANEKHLTDGKLDPDKITAYLNDKREMLLLKGKEMDLVEPAIKAMMPMLEQLSIAVKGRQKS